MHDADQSLPLVSVIVPFHNAGALAVDALERLRQLTYPRLEFVLVDDASADDTLTFLESFSSPHRVEVLALRQNVGPGPARNAGLEAAVGGYVWFVDWDDDWRADILDVLVDAALEHGADVVTARGRWRSPELGDLEFTDGCDHLNVVDPAHAMDLVLSGAIKGYLWNKLFRRAAVTPNVFPAMRTQEDICAVATIIGAGATVACIPDLVYWHVRREGSLTNSAAPDLRNLSIARETVRQAAARAGGTTERRILLLHYDYAYWLLSRAMTAIRLSDPHIAEREVREVRAEMRFGDIARLFPRFPTVATKALLLMLAGPRVATIRSSYVGLRARLRRRRVRTLFK